LKTTRHKSSSRPAPSGELAKLRARLADAEETLRAIRTGEVDTVMVAGKEGSQVFTLEGAEHAYRVLIESMNEGALTLTADKMILYANQCFARMVKCPLEQVTGSSFRRFLSVADRATLRPLLKRADKSGSKIQVLLHAGDGSKMPAQISIRPLAKNGSKSATFRHGGDGHDGGPAQRGNAAGLDAPRGAGAGSRARARGPRIARQHHPASLRRPRSQPVRWRTNFGRAPGYFGARKSRGEVMKLASCSARRPKKWSASRAICGPASWTSWAWSPPCAPPARNSPIGRAYPQAGLQAVDRAAARRHRVGALPHSPGSFGNVEKHARARHVTVRLRQRAFVQLTINDDGIGFDPEHHAARRKGKGGLGLLGMRERATYVGGDFKIKSVRGGGTKIEVLIPLPPVPRRST
jgi:two-component system NarL family sensor kinase